MHLPMSHQDIADYPGLNTEMVSRCCTHLRNEGVISVESADWVRILDRERLFGAAACLGPIPMVDLPRLA